MTAHTDAVATNFDRMFQPRTIGVVGASATGSGPANNFIRNLRDFGFTGSIYPVHRSASEIEGLRAFSTLAEVPEPIDYAYVAVAAEHVETVLASGARRVAFAQVISSGFSESVGGAALEAALVATARASGIRVIGPNCLGTHSPRGHLTFLDRVRAEAGPVGVLSQSGGLAADIARRGQVRGVLFSKLVSVGNCADISLAELLSYLLGDDETKVIGLYLESAGEARALFELLRRARTIKPVVILKGGRTAQGQVAAASHTGALASDYRLWIALARQTGSVLVETVDSFIDALLAFQMLQLNRTTPTRRVVLFGNGGGTSVLAVDHFAERGFELRTLGTEGIAAMRALKLPAGSIVSNPIDVPANAMRHEEGRLAGEILDIAYRHAEAHAVIMHINMTIVLGYRDVDMLGNLLRAAIEADERHKTSTHFMLVLRSDGEPEVETAKRETAAKALAAGIPVFDELSDAAVTLAAIREVEQFAR